MTAKLASTTAVCCIKLPCHNVAGSSAKTQAFVCLQYNRCDLVTEVRLTLALIQSAQVSLKITRWFKSHCWCEEQITRRSLTRLHIRQLFEMNLRRRSSDLETYLRRRFSSSWSSFWWRRSTSTCPGCKKPRRCEGMGCRNRRPSRWAPPSWGNTPPAK